MPRKMKKALVHRISLCPRGANKMPTFYKSEEGVETIQTLVKADMDEGLITAIAYAPDIEDAHGDSASAEVIKQMAYDFSLSEQGINIRHGADTLDKEKARVVESFIVQKGDERFSDMTDYTGEPVDVTGAWAVVIKVDDEELQQKYRDGEWNGVSIEGTGFFQKSDERLTLEGVRDLFKSLLGQDINPQEGDLDMKPEDVQKMIDAGNKKTLDGVEALLKEAGLVKKTDTKDDNAEPVAKDAPTFQGDMHNEDDRLAFKKELAIWEAERDITDPVKLFDRLEAIEKEFAPDDKDLDEQAGIEKEDSAEVRDLKRRLHKAQSRSNQPAADGKSKDDSAPEGLSKEDADLFEDSTKFIREMQDTNK